MQAATRLGTAFLLLIAAFLVLVVLAATSLVAARQPMLAAVVAVAGLAGVSTGVLTWRVARREEEEPAGREGMVPYEVSACAPRLVAATLPRRPIRVQSMPVANLPPAYVDAVMKGVRARTSALKAQSQVLGSHLK